MAFDPLALLVVAPLIAGAACLLIPERLKDVARGLALCVTLAELAGAIVLFIRRPVILELAGAPLFAVDTLAGFIGIGIAVFSVLVTVYSFGFIERSYGRYFGYLLLTMGCAFGVVYANELITLMSFWAFLGVTLYLLINFKGTDEAAVAAKRALLIIGGTDAAMLFGIGILWSLTGTTFMSGPALPIEGGMPLAAFLALATAAFAKAGVMPFHSWLPDVAESAPASVTAYLPASLDKLLGIYLLTRMSLDLFVMNSFANNLLCIVGVITIVLAVIFAIVQHDLKRLLGYHAISQVGYMVLGIGTGTAIGLAGGLFHMVNNAIYKSCLFLNSGTVEKKTGTADLSKLGGLARYLPVTFGSFLIASLAISGVPPFNGFVSKWLIYQGIIESGAGAGSTWLLWLVAAMFGSALTLASFMKLLHAVFLGRPSRDFSSVREGGVSLSLPVIILAALCVLFGIFAFVVPIGLFIAPALDIGILYIGTWSPVAATILLLAGIVVGALIYYLTTKPGQFRAVGTFVGGEDPDTLERVSGTEFYNTIKDLKWLRPLLRSEGRGVFDIYAATRACVMACVRPLQHLHNGILPSYLVWCLLGMILMFTVFFIR